MRVECEGEGGVRMSGWCEGRVRMSGRCEGGVRM